MFLPGANDPGLGRLERALALTLEAEPLRKKLRDAQKARILARGAELDVLDEAVTKNVLTTAERGKVAAAAEARNDAVQVDDYAPESYRSQRG
jgi:acyl-CoA dehydrogenase